jgi:hypothetical protein
VGSIKLFAAAAGDGNRLLSPIFYSGSENMGEQQLVSSHFECRANNNMMSGDKRGKIRSNGEKRERGKFHISVGYHADQEDFGAVKRFRIHPRICPEVVVLTNGSRQFAL